MTHLLIFGQHHKDPAPRLAVHHAIKTCLERGMHVVCGYEASQPFDQLIEETEKEPRSVDSASRLFLYRYLKSQSIKAVPVDSKELVNRMSAAFSALSENIQKDVNRANARGQYDEARKIDAASDDQFRHLMNGYEPERIAFMLAEIQKLHQESQTTGHDNTVIVLFDAGNIHAERLAKHATLQGIEATAIVCSAHPDFATEDMKKNTAARPQALALCSQQVDSEDIRRMKVPVVELTLRYNPRMMKAASSRGKLTGIEPGEFEDQAKLMPLLDRVIPVKLAVAPSLVTEDVKQRVISQGGCVHREGEQAVIQLPMPKFDGPLNEALQLNKTRVRGLTEAALTALKAQGVIIAADDEQGAHLLLFHAARRPDIEKICREGRSFAAMAQGSGGQTR